MALAAADARIVTADAAVERLQQDWQAASRELQAVAGRVGAGAARAAELRAALDGQPDAAGAAAALADLDRVETEARAADRALREARRRRDGAAREDQAAQARLADARTALDRARDPLVRLGAPPAGPGGPRRGLARPRRVGARGRRGARRAAGRGGVGRRGGPRRAGRPDRGAGRRAGGGGVAVPAGRPLAETAEAAVAAALQQARSAAARVAERRAEAAELAATRAAAAEQAQVAKLLGQVLRADGFERWLLASALDVLVADAARTLLELSGGQFELTHDGKDFAVIDHADADSLRPVRTLSGGETFQASLALALALSAQLAGLAAAGAARLDSIVLDEGFGSLDEATLDVVAGTLESLTAGGDRMVGVVTHVAALAERVPVRYAVRRDQAGSTVTREDVVMRFWVDAWDPSYGTSADPGTDDSDAVTDLGVELPAADWRPVPPRPVTAPAAVHFVDGVRRIDAHVWIDGPDGAVAGLAASYAAGVVSCRPGEARVDVVDVRRGLFTAAPGATAVRGPLIAYPVHPTAEGDELKLSLELQQATGGGGGGLRAACPPGCRGAARRGRAAARAVQPRPPDEDPRPDQDAPQAVPRGRAARAGGPAPAGGADAGLPGRHRWVRCSWYLRLPCRPGAPWAGVVRMECPDLPAAEAVALAGLSQAVLPRYASVEHKDQRAPQNLYPIGGLERLLRRRLGDRLLIDRALRRAAALTPA